MEHRLGISDADFVQVISEAVAGTLEDSDVADEWDTSGYLGQDVGLSPRESNVLALVTRGYPNQDIAEELSAARSGAPPSTLL